MRLLSTTVLALLSTAFAVRAASTAEPSAAAPRPVRLMNEKCPVTGEEVNPEIVHVWNGLEIRFCCEGCIPGFLKDTATYAPALLKQLAAQRDAIAARLEAAQKAAQVAAQGTAAPGPDRLPAPAAPIAPMVPLAGPAAPAAPPAPSAPMVPLAGPAAPALVDLGNAMCPVSETRPARAELFLEYHGMKVRLCCRGCTARFNADPATHLARLRAADPAVAQRVDAAETAWARAHAVPGPAPTPVPSR